MGERRERRLRPTGLAILAGSVTLLAAIGVIPRWPGVVHLVALPPLDVVTDLGWLLVSAPSWPWFLLGVAASLAIRAAVMAALLGGLRGDRFLAALRFYAVVLPVAFLAAVMLYASSAILFYGVFWFGLIAALVLLVVTAAAPWLGLPRLRSGFARAARGWFRAGTVGSYLAALTVIGLVADLTGPVGAVLLVPVSAAATYLAAQGLHDDPGWRLPRRAVAALPAAGMAALIVIVALGPGAPPVAPPPEDPREGSIMLMSGIDSSSGNGAILELDPNVMGWTCDRTFYYSYAGPGEGQPQRKAMCEITHGAPYDEEDTLRSRAQLVPFLEAQTATMVPPGIVAGHSQGVWLLWQAAAADRLPNVSGIVLVGPFTENRVAYPRSENHAPGWVGRAVLGVLAAIPRPGGTTVFRPDAPLGREWLADPTAIEQTLARPLPDDIRALGVASVFDLPLMETHRIEGAVDACPVPVIHPNLPYALEFQNAVARFAAGRPPAPCPAWRTWIGPLFRHFSVPPSG